MNTRSFSSATSRKTGALCRDSDPGPAQNSRILAQRAGRSILPMRLPTGLKIITPSSGSPRPQPAPQVATTRRESRRGPRVRSFQFIFEGQALIATDLIVSV